VFLKQLFSTCKVVQIEMVYFVSLVLRTFILETRKAKCFDFAIIQHIPTKKYVAHFEHTTSSQSYVLTLLLPFC
jgi:hypothetical protein